MSYSYHLVIYLEIYLIVALSLNLLVGYAGLFQLAHAAYFGVGAYTVALLMLRAGWDFLPAIGLAMAIAGVMSLAISLPAWKFRGDYFVMISMAVQAATYSFLNNWIDLTNGPYGLTGIPQPILLGHRLGTIENICFLTTIISGACLLCMLLLLKSPWGRLLEAMRDDELAARSAGKNTRMVKLQVSLLACSMVALAGGLYASYVGFIDPSSFTLDESILMLSMVIVGGTGNIRGPMVGAAFLIAMPEILRFMQVPDAVSANVRLMVYGLLLIGVAHFRPQGLAGIYRLQ